MSAPAPTRLLGLAIAGLGADRAHEDAPLEEIEIESYPVRCGFMTAMGR